MDEHAVGVTPDDLEHGRGPSRTLPGANLDGKADQFGWQVVGRSQAEPQPPPGTLAGCQPRSGPGMSAALLSGGPYGRRDRGRTKLAEVAEDCAWIA